MIIGQIIDDGKLECDLPALVDTRLLIQANSGGGKSWLLRLVAERAGIQTIVLDHEGEFASLREAVDMLLVGASGELPADPRHAALLARRLIEYKVSAVIDLYELKLGERRQFVKLFLDSLIHLPRELWRPTLVILDEAHIYCPERGSGDAESTEAVISLMSQGPKRGYAGIIATQRLSKLHKDAAAEANNVIIGPPCSMPIRRGQATRWGSQSLTGSSCVTWNRANFMPSARSSGDRGSCIFAPIGYSPLIQGPANVICLPHARHPRRFAGYSRNSPTCLMRRRPKSEASMRHGAGSPNWSGKSASTGWRADVAQRYYRSIWSH
jgi:hypothetical protein